MNWGHALIRNHAVAGRRAVPSLPPAPETKVCVIVLQAGGIAQLSILTGGKTVEVLMRGKYALVTVGGKSANLEIIKSGRGFYDPDRGDWKTLQEAHDAANARNEVSGPGRRRELIQIALVRDERRPGFITDGLLPLSQARMPFLGAAVGSTRPKNSSNCGRSLTPTRAGRHNLARYTCPARALDLRQLMYENACPDQSVGKPVVALLIN
jgi:hypothetical protein